jgi:hypothetical protein
VKTLVGGHREQPLGKCAGLAKGLQFGKEAKADLLEDVGGLVPGETVLNGYGKNQVLVFVD